MPQSFRRAAALIRDLLAAMVLAGTVLAVTAWIAPEPMLRWAAEAWIVSDPVAAADAVVVLGGGLDDRPFAAAAYYRQGLVKKVLVSDVAPGPAEAIEVLPGHAAANLAVLVKLGVPEVDIESFGQHPTNTHEEALALRDWAQRAAARSIIIPTEIFAARRLRWVLRAVFSDTVAIRVPALDPPSYRADDWWRHEAGLISFQNEIVKYIYYRFKY